VTEENRESADCREPDAATSEPMCLILEAASPEEARERAAETWGLASADVVVEGVEEERRLFGLLGKKLRFRVVPDGSFPCLRAKELSRLLLERMELQVEGRITDEGMIDLVGEDAGIVIGRYGETLKSLEYLTNLMLHDEGIDAPRVRFDSDGYRARREASLIRLAEAAARDAARRGRPVYLEPMSSWERRIVHLALKEDAEVETRSIGDEPFRKVVVWPKRAQRDSARPRGGYRRGPER